MTTFGRSAFAAVLAASGGFATTAAAQDTLRVPQDFATIQAAVDAAADGDTIRISKGLYPEFVQITGRSNLTVIGKRKSALLGTGVPGGGPAGRLAISGCNNILVKGLAAVDTAEGSAFSVEGSNGVTLQSCFVENPLNDDAFDISSSSDVTVDRCRVAGPGTLEVDDEPVRGVAISGSTQVRVLRTRIQDVADDGIHSAGSSDVLIQRCALRRIGDDGIHGSSSVTGGLITIDRCVLLDIGDDGIGASGVMTDMTITRTRILRTGDAGVEALGRALTLDRVLVTDAADDAFAVTPIAGPAEGGDGPVSITFCKALRIGDDGLRMDASDAVVTSLVLKIVDGDAISLSDCSGVSIDKVRLAKIGKGMRIFGVDAGRFTDFRMSKPSDGLYVDFASNNNTFEDWKVKAPTGDGFDIDGPDNTFIHNVVTGAGNYGFTVISSGNSFIENKAVKSAAADLQDTAGAGENSYLDNTFVTSEGP